MKSCREYEEERKKLLRRKLAKCRKQLRMARHNLEACERDIARGLLKIEAIRCQLGE